MIPVPDCEILGKSAGLIALYLLSAGWAVTVVCAALGSCGSLAGSDAVSIAMFSDSASTGASEKISCASSVAAGSTGVSGFHISVDSSSADFSVLSVDADCSSISDSLSCSSSDIVLTIVSSNFAGSTFLRYFISCSFPASKYSFNAGSDPVSSGFGFSVLTVKSLSSIKGSGFFSSICSSKSLARSTISP